MAGSERGREGGAEKGARYLRNFNAAVGGIALLGAVATPAILAAPLAAYGAFNMAQAGAFEVGRRHLKKKREQGRS